jgi:hypothetical protein
MDWQARLTATVISTIVRDFPKGFWEDARTGTRQSYLDVFHQFNADPNLVGEQRLDKLYQDRHFRMEHLLAIVARKHGLPCTPTLLATNSRHYVYVTKGAIGLTQAYVPAIGAMPKPARFREQLAAMNAIPNKPRLDLGDEPREALLGKDFYGLLAHNPAGRRFAEQDQRLGMIQFCVPVPDCSEWAVELTIDEITAAYERMAPRDKASNRGLRWKPDKKDDKKKGDDS